jgi:hypothetical protein
MDALVPPQSTLVVVLGAGEWPKFPDLDQELSERDLGSGSAFAGSAEKLKAYFLDEKRFKLPVDNLLDLFDSEDEPAPQLQRMATFLKDRGTTLENAGRPSAQLILYYVGHGGFVNDDFYLAIRTSEKDSLIASSLSPKSLAEVIAQNARKLRCFLLIDSCFAMTAGRAFESSSINGVSLLSSSASGQASRATHGEPYTMFSGALLRVLEEGEKEGPEWFSLRTLRKAVAKHIPVTGVFPVESSPVRHDGDQDIADSPLFPNAARRLSEDREWFVAKDGLARCYVVESATEEKQQRNDALSVTVGSALDKYRESLSTVIGKALDTVPVAANVDRIIASLQGFENAIRALCQAEIAVFDVTSYEPVVMLLLGIRSVVRRGVTIASAGGNYTIGDPINYPFSIKEVNIISHSIEQVKTYHPIDLIGEKILAGFEQLRHLPDYLDLPVFDAIRTLPPEREQRIPKEHKEQLLVLCPFSRGYTDCNWRRYLKPQLEVYLPKNPEGGPPRILRTLDMKSPRLVSQSLYEAMRLTQMCIVDWTEWRPNVFFELGVRLAAVDIDPVCIIETRHRELIEDLANIEDWDQRIKRAELKIQTIAEKNATPEDYTTADAERFAHVAYQSKRMLELFDLIDYKAPRQGRIGSSDRMAYEEMVRRHEQLIRGDDQPQGRKGLPRSFAYRTVSEHIDASMEVSAFPVHDELTRAADLLSDPQIDSVGRSPVLYPKNESLTGKANVGALERRLAAWYYIDNRLREELKENEILLTKFVDLGNLIARALNRSPHGNDREMAKHVRRRVKELEEQRQQKKDL